MTGKKFNGYFQAGFEKIANKLKEIYLFTENIFI